MNKPFVREHKTRQEIEGIFAYTLEMKFTSEKRRPIPDQLIPKIDSIFQEIDQELNDRIAKIFEDYEAEPVR